MWEEAGAVWPHLAVSGFLNGTYTGVASSGATYAAITSPPVVPTNAYQKPILLGHTDDYDDAGNGDQIVRLAYVFGAAPASILRELDVKLDDSVPGTGVVRATLETALGGEAALLIGEELATDDVILWQSALGSECVNGGEDEAGGTWNVDSNNTSCNAMFLY
jgi:hypothetical protein